MTPETFHESRQHRIGGRDAAAICGEDKYQTIHDVFLRLTGAIESHDDFDEEKSDGVIRRGIVLEPEMRRLYSMDKGLVVIPPDDKTSGHIIHPDKPWLGGHVDGWIDGEGGLGILECKSVTTAKLATIQRRGIDRAAMIQNLHYQDVDSLEWGAVIFHEPQFWGREIFTLDARESEAVADLRREVSEEIDSFWHNHVLTRIMPALPPASSGHDERIKSDDAIEVIDSPVYIALLNQLHQAEELVAESSEFKAGVKSDLDTFMQTNELAACEASTIIDGATRCLRYRWRELKGRRTLQGKVLVKFVQHLANLIQGQSDFSAVKAAVDGFDVERFFKTSEPKMAGRHDWISNRGDE